MTDNDDSAERKRIANIYAVLCVSLALCMVPMAAASGLALLIFCGAWIAVAVLRRRAPEHSLTADHMAYINRTLWLAGFFSVITMAIAAAYLLTSFDPSVLAPCADALMTASTPGAIRAAIAPCYGGHMPSWLVNATLMGVGPVIVYLAYRIAKGVTRALKGHRMGEGTGWF